MVAGPPPGAGPSRGVAANQQLRVRDAAPTAIFAANDDLAIDAITALQKRRLRVPHER